MSNRLDDVQLDELLSAADPVDPQAMQHLAHSPAVAAMGAAIARPVVVQTARRRYLRPAVLAAAAAAVAAVTVSVSLVPSGHHSAYGAALVSFAERSPRLLVGANDWRVTRADEDDAHTGEMRFAAGTRQLDVFWVPGAQEKESDKASMTPAGHAQIDGERAWVGYYGSAAKPEFEAIWSVGNQAREARGVFPTRAAFLAVATTLHRVNVDTWLDAMPDTVVKPSSRRATVETMLADIPQPQGLDISKLTTATEVLDRYQLGAKVTGAVACGWVHQWAHGDPAQRTEAATAMRGSHDWAILKEMNRDGDYPEVLWEIAGAMNGKPVHMTPGVSLEEWSKPALGC